MARSLRRCASRTLSTLASSSARCSWLGPTSRRLAGVERPEPRFDWFIPIDGDGEHIGTERAERPPTFDYLRQVVQTAEDEGYSSLLIPTRFANGLFDEGAPLAETWTMATALAA